MGFVWLGAGWQSERDENGVVESPRLLRTSPGSDDIIGYSGPNDCELRLGADGRIESVRLIRSGDTVEHAEAIREDAEFLAQFRGLSESSLDDFAEIDGVSRATLTSLAVIEAVAERMCGQRPSLRFPEPIALAEVRRVLPAASHVDVGASGHTSASLSSGWFVRDRAGAAIAWAIRTGPLTESVIGYQGPTDTLLVFSLAEQRLQGLSLRRSYDNEPYVGYIVDDRDFAAQWLGKSIGELARMAQNFDRDQSFDGVSGATMTSQAVAEAIVRTAARLQARQDAPPKGGALWTRDIGMWIALVLALGLTFSRLRGHRGLRRVTRVATVLYLGVLSGDLLSQGLLLGWVENGLPVSIAPGLVALLAVAILIPVTTGRQTYCHQLCPHGALQELLRRMPWRRPVSPPVYRVLRYLPGGLLLVSVSLFALTHSTRYHAGLEPFGAWAWPLAGWATCTLALTSLLVASFYPMSYCRLACPTGYLLDFLRRRQTDQYRHRDGVALALLCTWFLCRG